MRSDVFGFAWALLVAAMGLAAPGEEGPTIDLRVIPGFEGQILFPFRFPLVIEIENGLAESACGDLAIARGSGLPAVIATDLKVPPGTTVRRRVTVVLAAGKAEPVSLDVSYSGGPFPHSGVSPPLLASPGILIGVHESAGEVHPAVRFGSRYVSVKTCRPAYLPVDTFAYDHVLAVLLCDADPDRWETDQVAAIEEYVRRGGLLVVDGGERGRVLASSSIVSRWTTGQGRRIAAPGVGDFADAFPLGLGTVLRSRIDVIANLDRLVSPAEEEGKEQSEDAALPAYGLLDNPEIVSHAVAYGGWMLVATKELGSRVRELPATGAVPFCAGFFLLFVGCLVAAIACSFRARRVLRPILALGAVSVAFALAVPLIIAGLDRLPCPTSVFRNIRYGPDGAGVEFLAAGIRSNGGERVRLAFGGRNLVAYDMTAQAGGVRGLLVQVRPPLRQASEISLDLPMERWKGACVLALSDSPGPPPVDARAFLKDGMIYIRLSKDPRHEGRIHSAPEVRAGLDDSQEGPLAGLLAGSAGGRFWTGIFLDWHRVGFAGTDPSNMIVLADISGNSFFDRLGGEEPRIITKPLSPESPMSWFWRDADPETVPDAPPAERCVRRGWVLLSYWADTPSQAMTVGGECIRIVEEVCHVEQVVPIEEEMP